MGQLLPSDRKELTDQTIYAIKGHEWIFFNLSDTVVLAQIRTNFCHA